MTFGRFILILAAGLAWPHAGPAGDALPPPFEDFTFRRIRPPSPGTVRRITIQIAPEEPDADAPPLARAVAVAPATAGPLGWFWKDISPDLADGGPGRLQAALAVIEADPAGRALPVPSVRALRAVTRAHGRDILMSTVGTRISPALVLAVIGVESSGRSDARSDKGAVGLMQLMPETAARFDVVDATDSAQNIRGGVAYLDWLFGKFGGDPVLALAAYNAGAGALRDSGGVPPFPETRAYVPKVLAAWRIARLLCTTPPELISDGCVFVPAAKG